MRIIKAAQLDGYSPRKDGSFSLRFVTQEQSPQEVAELHQMVNDYGYLYFRAEETLTKDEIEDLDKLDTDLYDKPKTQSQRIRNTLYKAFMLNDRGYKDFAKYYKARTEKIIEIIKSELDY
tara:strand:+ start:1183 stop:1545 length:363 start_codon:yes stop_codon:yes gene_type:complete